MGNVFRATDNMLDREVALKMLHPQLTMQPQFLERFKKEARVLAQLLHPNIAVIYNFIEQGNNHFMVMEYVEGITLDELKKKYQTIPLELIIPICIQALEGLQHAHKKNIFHRDIKPSNLMLTPDGVLKLMDFGIAKVAGEQKMTQVNKIVGTIEFMAPELIEGKQASVASDIYAMGATMYELVSGKLPFESDTDFNLMQAILKKKVRPPDKINASVPKALGDILLKALEKNPENRYPNARAFQQALISAFPGYREIDLSILNKPAQPENYTHYAGAATVLAGSEFLFASAMETKVESNTVNGSIFQKFEQKILLNKKLPYIMIAAGLVIVAIIVLSIAIHKNHPAKDEEKKDLSKNDTTKNANGNIAVLNNTPDATVVSPEIIEQPVPVNKHSDPGIIPDKPGTEKIEKKKSGKKEDPDKKETVLPVKNPEEKKEPEPPVIKHTEKKDVYIDSKLEVNLYLRDNLGESEREKERSVSFSVTSNVVYDGVVIIKQGAIANGYVNIGRMMTSVNINSVMGANGQELEFKSARFHRKRRELGTDRNYSATLQKGIRMSF